jgi:hypothetical protein
MTVSVRAVVPPKFSTVTSQPVRLLVGCESIKKSVSKEVSSGLVVPPPTANVPGIHEACAVARAPIGTLKVAVRYTSAPILVAVVAVVALFAVVAVVALLALVALFAVVAVVALLAVFAVPALFAKLADGTVPSVLSLIFGPVTAPFVILGVVTAFFLSCLVPTLLGGSLKAA